VQPLAASAATSHLIELTHEAAVERRVADEAGMTGQEFDYTRAEGKKEWLGHRCESRTYDRPEELAVAICFVVNDHANYITSQALAIDGGNTSSLNVTNRKV
jgi:meso-butanediol dehydrogenase/(S,S)-butanediol dehydrogenase/diacetyl reductase